MVTINLECIMIEISKIINKFDLNKFNCNILLYCLGIQESIKIIKMNKRITNEFIFILQKIEKYIVCDIDINFYIYLKKNDVDIDIDNVNLDMSVSSSTSSSTDSLNLNTKIEKMLQKDMILLNNLIESNNVSNNASSDMYGKINSETINLSKKIFNYLDHNKDGFISALDAIKLIDRAKKNPLIFEFDINVILVKLLILFDNKIDFDNFFTYFII